jgi:hypothetical protein
VTKRRRLSWLKRQEPGCAIAPVPRNLQGSGMTSLVAQPLRFVVVVHLSGSEIEEQDAAALINVDSALLTPPRVAKSLAAACNGRKNRNPASRMPNIDMGFSEEGWDLMNQSKPKSPAVSAATKQARIRRRNRMITSCLECRRRKLKCDKLVRWQNSYSQPVQCLINHDSTHAPIAPSSRGTATSSRPRWTRHLR